MAKKFTNLNKGNESPDSLSILVDSANGKTPQPAKAVEKKEISDIEIAKTYQYLDGDIEFLKEYARTMAFNKNMDYPIKVAIRDAISLLRKKHPEVAERIKK